MSEANVIKPLWEGWRQPTKPSEALGIGLEYARMEGLWCSGSLLELREEQEHRSFESGYERHPSNPSSPKKWKMSMGPRDRRCACKRCVKIREYRDKLATEELGCGDVKACSIGILIMSILDGPAVNAYFNRYNKEYIKKLYPTYDSRRLDIGEFIEDLLTSSEVGRAACVFLHAGMNKLKLERDPTAEESMKFKTPDPVDMIKQYIAGPQPGPKGGNPRVSENRFREMFAEGAKQSVIHINDAGPALPDEDHEDESSDANGGIILTKGEEYHQVIAKGFEYGQMFAREWEGQLGFGADAEPVKV